ncbi:MAG: hypothetical protein HYY76_04795 [Acidobacteria bacterium]|nr:hypothetical protein [Acidobacteriota bacterium]
MEAVLRYIFDWPSLNAFLNQNPWGWPLLETTHFVGLALLFGIIMMFDLRMLGVAKELPLRPFRRLLPWAIFGFALAVVSGLGFTLGLGANLFGVNAYDVLVTNLYLQLKLILIILAGLNILFFYVTGVGRQVDDVGPGEDVPGAAKAMAAASLVLWTGVVYFGRLVPWGL